jgi:hypothetical protein
MARGNNPGIRVRGKRTFWIKLGVTRKYANEKKCQDLQAKTYTALNSLIKEARPSFGISK